MGRWRTRTALWGVALFVLTTGVPLAGAQEGTSPTTTPSQRLPSIAVSPASANLQVGEQLDFSATGYDDGDEPFWMTDHGTITQEGVYTAPDEPAMATVTLVASDGVVHVPVAVNARDQDLITISVTPPSVNLGFGEQEQFTAIGQDQDGNPMFIAPTWSTNNGTITQDGLYTAPNEAGTATITATADEITGTAVVDLLPMTASDRQLTSISVTPPEVNLEFGVQQQFTAIGYDDLGNEIDPTVTWGASNGTITQDGLYTAPNEAGTATITATANGIAGTARVTVVSAGLAWWIWLLIALGFVALTGGFYALWKANR